MRFSRNQQQQFGGLNNFCENSIDRLEMPKDPFGNPEAKAENSKNLDGHIVKKKDVTLR